jgi:two-component system, response regulator YesN
MPGILVADDEIIVRSTVKTILYRGNLDFGPVYEAGSGEEAISIARQVQPSIVLMDVKMPGLNGLEAARTIRKESPNSKIIMLTAYDEFAFSQEAVRLGAVDYLLKPVRPAGLLEVLSKIMGQIEAEKKQMFESEHASQQLRDMLPLIESSLIFNLVNRQVSGSAASSLIAKYLGKEIKNPALIIVNIDHFTATIKGMEDEKVDQLCNLLVDIVRRAFPNQENCLIGQIHPGIIVLIISTKNDYQTTANLKSVCHTLRHAIEAGAPVSATISISRAYSELDKIPACFDEAEKAQWYKVRFGRNSVIHIEDIEDMAHQERSYPVDLEYELIDNVRLGQRQTSMDLIRKIAAVLLEDSSIPPEVIKSRFVELAVIISRTVISSGAPILDVLNISHKSLRSLEDVNNSEELLAWALNALDQMMAALPGSDRTSNLIEQVVKIMREKLDEPNLSLKDMAAEVHVSSSHLAHLFKEKTGVSFVKLLTQLRLEKAKKLLGTTDMTVAAVSQVVGYEDSTYFHRIFRREIHMTPTAYRQMVRTD